MHTSLDPYKDQFRAAVLTHVNEKLGEAEWKRLRAFAADKSRHVIKDHVVDLDVAPEELIGSALTVDSISVQDTLIPEFKVHAEEIAIIEGQPVYYIRSQGIYFWGRAPVENITLMFWATHPAYPPMW